MPIPKPKSREKRSEFVSRCVSAISDEYKDNKQAVAICYSQFEEGKASAEMVVELDGMDQMLIFKKAQEEPMSDYVEEEDEPMDENEPMEDSEEDYKEDLFEMSAASISSIAQHAQNIVDALENPQIKKNLQEAWLQGRIAVTEENMLQIHNFVMFSKED
jgi:hypothetical protein